MGNTGNVDHRAVPCEGEKRDLVSPLHMASLDVNALFSEPNSTHGIKFNAVFTEGRIGLG